MTAAKYAVLEATMRDVDRAEAFERAAYAGGRTVIVPPDDDLQPYRDLAKKAGGDAGVQALVSIPTLIELVEGGRVQSVEQLEAAFKTQADLHRRTQAAESGHARAARRVGALEHRLSALGLATQHLVGTADARIDEGQSVMGGLGRMLVEKSRNHIDEAWSDPLERAADDAMNEVRKARGALQGRGALAPDGWDGAPSTGALRAEAREAQVAQAERHVREMDEIRATAERQVRENLAAEVIRLQAALSVALESLKTADDERAMWAFDNAALRRRTIMTADEVLTAQFELTEKDLRTELADQERAAEELRKLIADRDGEIRGLRERKRQLQQDALSERSQRVAAQGQLDDLRASRVVVDTAVAEKMRLLETTKEQYRTAAEQHLRRAEGFEEAHDKEMTRRIAVEAKLDNLLMASIEFEDNQERLETSLAGKLFQTATEGVREQLADIMRRAIGLLGGAPHEGLLDVAARVGEQVRAQQRLQLVVAQWKRDREVYSTARDERNLRALFEAGNPALEAQFALFEKYGDVVREARKYVADLEQGEAYSDNLRAALDAVGEE